WNFCADLESKGQRRAIGMDRVMTALGAKGPVAIVGYTFDGNWAAHNRSTVDRFLEAARQAKAILAASELEWQGRAPPPARRPPASLTPTRSPSTASATAKASCAARWPTRRPTRRRSIACWPRSAARSWSARRASSQPERSTARPRGSDLGARLVSLVLLIAA